MILGFISYKKICKELQEELEIYHKRANHLEFENKIIKGKLIKVVD